MAVEKKNGKTIITVDEKHKKEKAKVDFNKAGNLQKKIDVIAEYLGLKEQS